ncbi:MAG: hypothetical protein ABI867_37230 [Kofleriaceae bacterium]
MLRLAVVVILLAVGSACTATKSPEMRVIGVTDAPRHEVVFVQVTNPAKRPMKLTKLEYVFAASGGSTVSEGELELSRDVPAGAAIVVEVPLDAAAGSALTLRGRLTAELDQIVQIFKVSAEIHTK